jgi:hypothetical protein
MRVCIYWPHDAVWYKGKVVKYFAASKKFKILYDDTTEENLDLTKEDFVIEDKSQEDKKLKELYRIATPVKRDLKKE